MSITAMKQALEALIDLTNEMVDQDFVNQGMNAITALRQAIEQAEKREWVGLTDEELETTHWSPDFRAGAKWA